MHGVLPYTALPTDILTASLSRPLPLGARRYQGLPAGWCFGGERWWRRSATPGSLKTNEDSAVIGIRRCTRNQLHQPSRRCDDVGSCPLHPRQRHQVFIAVGQIRL